MLPLRASWLGSWVAPWGPGRGRRWGDAPWALGAISQAWLMGGREGHWPRTPWQSGPRPSPWSGEWSETPDPAWVALLRHGSPRAEAERRGQREGELEAWCWAELLQGRTEAWWAQATLLLSLEERIRWITWLGAVDEAGRLHLPPYLSPLVPGPIHCLPQGWWETLLKDLDATGHLLPVGSLPQGPPWELLTAQDARCLHPLILEPLPSPLLPFQGEPWLHPLPGKAWMIDPRIRAWGRGDGLPEPPRGLAFGAPPGPAVAAILMGKTPQHPWARPIREDLEARPLNDLPSPCGEPTLDRLRMRWGGEAPPPTEGYPAWGTGAHPCADPFHWMAEGRRSFLAQDLETALRAFTLAHAHFQRLGSPLWASRAAANAGSAALFWGDLQGLRSWKKTTGPQPSPYAEHDEALLKACSGQWQEALPLLRRLTVTHPDFEAPWVLLALHGLKEDSPREVAACLPHLSASALLSLLQGYLKGDFSGALPDLGAEEQLQWEFLRIRHGQDSLPAFWSAWDRCSNHLLRLETGLLVLEARAEERSSGRLLQLEAITKRTCTAQHRDRLQALWPTPVQEAPRPAPELLADWLDSLGLPAWMLWEGGQMGCGQAPPEALVARLQREGQIPPCEVGDRVWMGLPLCWEGSRVGSALVGLSREDPPGRAQVVEMAAPWVAQLLSRPSLTVPLHTEALLADGSEPMASVLKEMARVAPTGLPVLILGPSGSGKELVASELHRLSGRSGPLVPVNCAAFAESLLESELFGHVKGAFTGADRPHTGAIEQAHGGTLFLDEIADLSPRLQSLFLRVLQEKELRRVGGNREIKVDVRFVAATHRNLETLVAGGSFRADLLYRLQGTVLHLPSLDARRHEFPYLVPRLVARIAQENGQGSPPLAPGLPQALARHPWPGNFRELRHALARAMLRCGPGPLKAEHFPELGKGPNPARQSWVESTQHFQRQLLRENLHRYGFHVSETAASLGLTRPALYAAAKRVGLDLVAEKQRWQKPKF